MTQCFTLEAHDNVTGARAGVAAGATDSSSLKVGLNTASAGNYSSSATLQLQSHNPDMADLALPTKTVGLVAQDLTVLKVKVQSANVRSEPDMNAAVVKQVKLGTLLESRQNVGKIVLRL